MANEFDTLMGMLEENDLRFGDHTIMVTGNGFLLREMHGILLETEEHYPDLELDDGKVLRTCSNSYVEDLVFKNYIMLSIGSLSRYANREGFTVKKRRPQGFVSSSSSGKEAQISSDIIEFSEMYSSELTEPKIRRYNTDGGITIASKDDGSLFDLSDATVVTKNTEEVVKRVKIPHSILMELLKDKDAGKQFFKQIKEEMESLGCPHYTFKRPDGCEALYREDYHSNIELRACGIRLEE